MIITKKCFREWLNKTNKNDTNYRFKRYRQIKRGYGDYLYFQDRERFNYYFNIFLNLKKKTRKEFEAKI